MGDETQREAAEQVEAPAQEQAAEPERAARTSHGCPPYNPAYAKKILRMYGAGGIPK